MQYYLNGTQIECVDALARMMECAELRGHAWDDCKPVWNARRTSETCREILTEISDGTIEFILE